LSETSEQSAAPPVEKIESLQYIRVLLEQAVSRCSLVNISDLTNNQNAISTLLRVDGDGRMFIMDKPYFTDNSNEERKISKSEIFSIVGKSRGASLSFEAEFKDIIKEDGLNLYRFSFPKEVVYSAQRASHRVDTRDFDTSIPFTTSSGYSFDAPLRDISDGGLRVRAGRADIKSITKGDRIYCALDIGDNSGKKLEVKLCKPSKVDDPNMIEFGATFIELFPYQKTLISHYIAGLERKMLRKQHAIPEAIPLIEAEAKSAEEKNSQSAELEEDL